jgi:hypothetical protein
MFGSTALRFSSLGLIFGRVSGERRSTAGALWDDEPAVCTAVGTGLPPATPGGSEMKTIVHKLAVLLELHPVEVVALVLIHSNWFLAIKPN